MIKLRIYVVYAADIPCMMRYRREASITSYVSLTNFAQKHAANPRTVKQACQLGVISGAIKQNGEWTIPENAVYATNTQKRILDYVSDHAEGKAIDEKSFVRDSLLSFDSEKALVKFLSNISDSLKWVFAEYGNVGLCDIPLEQLPDYLVPDILINVLVEGWWKAHSTDLYSKAKRSLKLPSTIASKKDYDASQSFYERLRFMLEAYASYVVAQTDLADIESRIYRALDLFGIDLLQEYDSMLPTIVRKHIPRRGVSFDEDQLRQAAISAWWKFIKGQCAVLNSKGQRTLIKASDRYTKYEIQELQPMWFSQVLQTGILYPQVP